jgi:Flp pilus assembly protein TadG
MKTVTSSSFLRLLRRDTGGLAVLEFALTLPFFVTTLLYGVDTMSFAVTHQQMSRMAISTADLAARYRASIDEKDIVLMFLGAKMGANTDRFDDHGRLVLSSVTRNAANNGHWVRWQRCLGDLDRDSQLGGENAGQTSTAIADVDGMVLNNGDNVMFAEVFYTYQPLFFDNLFGETEVHYTATFMSRELSLLSLTNTSDLTEAQKKKCPVV